MQQFLVSYEIGSEYPDADATFVNHAHRFGWTQWLALAGGQANKLPRATLVGHFVDANDAASRFEMAVAAASETLGYPLRLAKYIIADTISTRSASDNA